MKRFLACMLSVASLAVSAQSFNVESASIALSSFQKATTPDDKKVYLEEAKNTIDKAAKHPDTQNDPKMWLKRGTIYEALCFDTLFRYLKPADAVDIMVESYIGCIKAEEGAKKQKFTADARFSLVTNGAVAIYQKAYALYSQGDYAGSIKAYRRLLEIQSFDLEKRMEGNNMSERDIYYSMAVTAIGGQMKAETMEFLQKCIDKKYNDPVVYRLLANAYTENKQPEKALEIIEKGRYNFPQYTPLIIDEINYYIGAQKVDKLIEKLNVAVEADPENANLFYIRGQCFQTLADTLNNKNKPNLDTLDYFSKQVKQTADPKKKAALQAKMNSFKATGDSIAKIQAGYMANSERDYGKAIELNPGMADAYYNLAAFYLNQTPAYTEKMNKLPYSAEKEYNDLKAKRDVLYNKAIPNFEKALENLKSEQVEDEMRILDTLKQIYGQLGNVEKSMEYRKKLEAAKKKAMSNPKK